MGDPINVIAVVQARMGSSRFPGKVLTELGGRPLVDHVLRRLNKMLVPHGPLDRIILVTSDRPSDDILAEHIKRLWPDVDIIRGSETDLLSRFILSIERFSPKTIIRVTGDCPILNEEGLQQMLKSHIDAEAEITNYRPGYEYVDKGIEIVSCCALSRSSRDKRLTALDREHVTTLMYRHPESYRVNYIDSEPKLRRSDIRLTVDTVEDAEFFNELFRRLGNLDAGVKDIISFLDDNPEILSLNASKAAKSTMHEKIRLAFRCDGGAALGLGHIIGSIRMARLLAESSGIGIEFIIRGNSASEELIRRAGFTLNILPENISPKDDIEHLISRGRQYDWRGVVINFNRPLLEAYQNHFCEIKKSGLKLIFMDNPLPPGWREGDMLFNALPHPDYPGYAPSEHPYCFDGLEYFLVGDSGDDSLDGVRRVTSDVNQVLVSMGGGDSFKLTEMVLRGLGTAEFKGHVDVVLGAASGSGSAAAAERILESEGLQGAVSTNVADMRDRMRQADIGFTALGLTTYEMAHTGLASLIVTESSLNSTAAMVYCDANGLAEFVGVLSDITPETIKAKFIQLKENYEKRKLIAGQGPEVVGRLRYEIPELVSSLFD